MMDVLDYFLLFFICLASITFHLVISTKKQTDQAPLPPSPRAVPIIGHLHLLGRIPHQALHKLSVRYGPLIYIFFGSKPCVVVSSPEIAKEFLKTYEHSFLKRPKLANIDYLTYGSSDFTMAPYGPYWKFMKKLCMTELLGGQTLNLFSPVRQEEINQLVQSILKKAEASEPCDVGAELVRLTNNIISRMALRKRCSANEDEADKIRKLVKEMTELAGKGNLSDLIWCCKYFDFQGFGKRLKDVRDRYDNMMERIIEEHKVVKKAREKSNDHDNDTTKDILDILLDIYEDESSEVKLTRENIKAFIMNIFGAGTDTSSITVEWALAELINHPDVMEKAREEIDHIVGKNRIVQESDIACLPYLQAIVKETLRLHPTGPLIVRESTEDCIINTYKIPAKTQLIVNVWSIGRNPNHWEDPLEFRPERFLGEEGNGKSQFLDIRGQNFHLLPFGTGRRSCPGASLALLVVPTTLAAMIQCFEWRVGERGKETVNMDETPGLSLPRAHPLISVPVARLNPVPLI